MARIMSQSRPPSDGYTGLKFSEIVVFALIIAGLIFGVKWFLDYRRSAGFALSEFLAAVKAGNVEKQYALIDQSDKDRYFQKASSYERSITLAHGYTERIENTSLAPEIKKDSDPDTVVVPATISIRGSTEGKKLYQTAGSSSFSDNFVMHKGADGAWRVVLSASIDKTTHALHMQAAKPSETSNF